MKLSNPTMFVFNHSLFYWHWMMLNKSCMQTVNLSFPGDGPPEESCRGQARQHWFGPVVSCTSEAGNQRKEVISWARPASYSQVEKLELSLRTHQPRNRVIAHHSNSGEIVSFWWTFSTVQLREFSVALLMFNFIFSSQLYYGFIYIYIMLWI